MKRHFTVIVFFVFVAITILSGEKPPSWVGEDSPCLTDKVIPGYSYCVIEAWVWPKSTVQLFHLDIHRMFTDKDHPDIQQTFYTVNSNSTLGAAKSKDICWGKRLSWSILNLNQNDTVGFGFRYLTNLGMLPLAAVWSNKQGKSFCAPLPLPLWEGSTFRIAIQPLKLCCEDNSEMLGVGELTIEREWAYVEKELELEDISWNSNMVNALEWRPNTPDVIYVAPGEHTWDNENLNIPYAACCEAILVRYKVMKSNGDLLYRILYQIEIATYE